MGRGEGACVSRYRGEDEGLVGRWAAGSQPVCAEWEQSLLAELLIRPWHPQSSVMQANLRELGVFKTSQV